MDSPSIASPRPRRPNGGILVRSPSTDCAIKRCVKWAQRECQIYECDEWDRSPCPVTPKLTYRDLVELKQLELDKVPHSPFKSLADLPMPIGLPRVRVGLQPIFDRPSSSPPASSTSSPTTSSSSVSALHPPTPNTTPVPTPPRIESPSSSSSNLAGLRHNAPNVPSSLSNSISPSSNGPYNPMMRKSFAASSATNLAKVPSTPSSISSSNPYVAPPPPPSLPKRSSFADFCTPSPAPKPPVIETSSSSNDADSSSSDSKSHPALELASALLSQRAPSPIKSSSVFPLGISSPKTPTTASSVAAKKKKFHFMPLLPSPEPSEPSEPSTPEPEPEPEHEHDEPATEKVEHEDDAVMSSPPHTDQVLLPPPIQTEESRAAMPSENKSSHSSSPASEVVSESEASAVQSSVDIHEMNEEEDDDDDDDDDLSRARSPAELMRIGSDVDIHVLTDSTFSPVPSESTSPIHDHHTNSHHAKHGAPPSEADTESTLHGDDHHFFDHDAMTEVASSSASSWCGDCADCRGDGAEDPEPSEEPEEPDEPHEPDLVSSLNALLLEGADEVEVESDHTVTPTESVIAPDLDGDDCSSPPGSPLSTTSTISSASTRKEQGGDTPAPRTLTRLAELVSTHTAVQDEDMPIRFKEARGRDPKASPMTRAERVLSPSRLGSGNPGVATFPKSPPPSSASSTTPIANRPASSAWENVAW